MSSFSAAVQRMIQATNAEDRAAFVACFTEDAYLEDWGRGFHGHDGISEWDESDNIGKHARFEATLERVDGEDHIVTLIVTGGGFNGSSDVVFRFEGDLISRMIIPTDD